MDFVSEKFVWIIIQMKKDSEVRSKQKRRLPVINEWWIFFINIKQATCTVSYFTYFKRQSFGFFYLFVNFELSSKRNLHSIALCRLNTLELNLLKVETRYYFDKFWWILEKCSERTQRTQLNGSWEALQCGQCWSSLYPMRTSSQ